MARPRLIILIGNIGSGKTTTVKEYAKDGYNVICRDDFRTMLGAGKYKFDAKTERPIHSAARALLESLMIEDLDIIVDETNVSKRGRQQIIKTAKAFGYSITGIVMPRLSRAQSIENRKKDTLRENTAEVWGQVWDRFNRAYEEPTLDEGFDSLIWRDEP